MPGIFTRNFHSTVGLISQGYLVKRLLFKYVFHNSEGASGSQPVCVSESTTFRAL